MSPKTLMVWCFVGSLLGFVGTSRLLPALRVAPAASLPSGSGQPRGPHSEASPSGALPHDENRGRGASASELLEQAKTLLATSADNTLPHENVSPRWMEAIVQLTADQLIELLEADAASLKPNHPGRSFLIRRIAEIAPLKAAELWKSPGGTQAPSVELIHRWAKRDPSAYIAWSLQTLDSVTDEQAKKALMEGVSLAVTRCERSPATWTRLSEAITGTPLEKAFMTGFRERISEMSADATAQFLEETAHPGLRQAGYYALAQKRDVNLEKHPALLPFLASLDKEKAASIFYLEIHDVSGLWDRAEELIKKLPSCPLRDKAFEYLFQNPSLQNQEAISQKLASLDSSDYPSAVVGLLKTQRGAIIPQQKIDWALSIPPTATQERALALDLAARDWFAKNPQEARAWVKTAPLTDAEYLRLTGAERQK